MPARQQHSLHSHHPVADHATLDNGGRGDLASNYDNCEFRRRLVDDIFRSYLIQGFVQKMMLEKGAVEPIGILICPFPRCKAQFKCAAYLISHMVTCDGYASGEFYCPDCKRYEAIPAPKDPEAKPSWMKRKASNLVRRFSGRRSPSPTSSTHTAMPSPLANAAHRKNSECVSDGLMLDPLRAESTLEPIEFAETIDKHIADDQFKHILRAFYAPQGPSHIYHPKPVGPPPNLMGPQSAAPLFPGVQAHVPPHAMLSNPQFNTIDWNQSQSSDTSYGSSLSSLDLVNFPISPATGVQDHSLAQVNWQSAAPLLDRGFSSSPTPMEPSERLDASPSVNDQWVPELDGNAVTHEVEGSIPQFPPVHRPTPRRPSGPNSANFAAPNYANTSVDSVDGSFYTASNGASETKLPASVYPPTPVRTETIGPSGTSQDSGYGTEQTTTKDADAALSPLDVIGNWGFVRTFTPSPPSSEGTQSPIPNHSLVSPLPDVLPNASSEDLVCLVCGYVPRGKAENRRRYLVKHKEVHKNNKFQCNLCPSTYNRKDNLVKHVRTDHYSALPAKRPAWAEARDGKRQRTQA